MRDHLVGLLALGGLLPPHVHLSDLGERDPIFPHPSDSIVIRISPSVALKLFHFSRRFASVKLASSTGLLASI